MKCPLRHAILFAMAVLATVLAEGWAVAYTLPEDLWLRPGETYVDLDATNTPIAATNWGFPDTSDDYITVSGNVADSSGHDPIEMDMTISGLVGGTTYSIDAVVFGKTDENAQKYGVAAGFDSGFLDPYDMIGTYGRPAVLSKYSGDPVVKTGVLYRVALGDTDADLDGEIHVFMDKWSNRSEIDGIIYREPVTPPTPTLITSVSRSGGAEDDHLPIGPYNGSSGVFASSDYGLQLGNQVLTDRNYVFDVVDTSLRGAEYIRTFNGDRDTPDVNYAVTFPDEVYAMVSVDDRALTPQTYVDTVVDDFADPGDFTDTGLEISWNSETSEDLHLYSVYGGWLDAGTYNFGGAARTAGEPGYGVKSFYNILAMEDAPFVSYPPGDADKDRDVDADDAQILALNWGDSGAEVGWDQGDFDEDHVVGPKDAAILAANWGYGVTPPESTAPVPEPSTALLLLGLAAGTVLWGRRRG